MCFVSNHWGRGGFYMEFSINSIYLFIDSSNTYSLRSMPCAWYIVRHWGVEIYTFSPPSWDISEPTVFLTNLSCFLIFTLLSLNLYIFREFLVHRRKLTLFQPLGKTNVPPKYQDRLQWMFYNNLLFHLAISPLSPGVEAIPSSSLALTAHRTAP